jgi:tetratricopeptide (TPR) repeat protein
MNGNASPALAKLMIVAALPILVGRAAAADKPDFSGYFTSTAIKGSSKAKASPTSTLQAVQSDAEIVVTRTADGDVYTNRFRLDGAEAPSITETGVRGVSTARFKGKTLIVDTRVAAHPQPNGPAVQIHSIEQWTLSSDLKTLTIRNDVEFPNSGLGGFKVIEPWSEVYTRSQPPAVTAGPLRLALPNRPWVLEVAAPGFLVTQSITQPDGRRYLLAGRGLFNLSITIESVKGRATLDGCREVFRGRIAPGGLFQIAAIDQSTIGEMAVLEYMIPQANGLAVKQKNLFGCLVKDDVYADIHISKSDFQDQDQAPLTAILRSAAFTDADGDAALLFGQGSAFFLRKDFEKAIGPYQSALDREKVAPKLPQPLWRVLIDNLAMAYGITGKLDAAEDVVKYGLSKDPEYPMFYFLMADAAAERNDLENTMRYLRLALQFRANMNPGEKLPDPLTDDSFKRFAKDAEFQKLAAAFR